MSKDLLFGAKAPVLNQEGLTARLNAVEVEDAVRQAFIPFLLSTLNEWAPSEANGNDFVMAFVFATEDFRRSHPEKSREVLAHLDKWVDAICPNKEMASEVKEGLRAGFGL